MKYTKYPRTHIIFPNVEARDRFYKKADKVGMPKSRILRLLVEAWLKGKIKLGT